MSGGHFEYKQRHIRDIADEVADIIDKNGKPREWDELDYYDRHQYSKREYEALEHKPVYYGYSPEVIERFKEGLLFIRRAYIYARRIDWLLSGDDGEESFMRRLEQELSDLRRKEAEDDM